MKPMIAVFGSDSIGHTITADLTFAGYKVNLLELPRFKQRFTGIKKLGGIMLSGNQKALVSKTVGLAKPNMVTTDAKKALEDVDVIFIDVPVEAWNYEARFKAIAPYLKDDQIIHFNTYSYWPSIRVAKILRQIGKEDIILSESPAPIYWTASKDGYATPTMIRGRLPLGVFPSKKSKEAFDVLKQIFPTFELAKNVLQTSFDNINMLVHPGMALLNIGEYDRKREKNEQFDFYRSASTVHAGILDEARDRERMAVCQAYKVPYTSLRKYIIRYYGSKGETVTEAIRNCGVYQGGTFKPSLDQLKKTIGLRDVPLAMVPLVLLAELAGMSTPITKSIIEIFGAIFETNFWKTGLTLEKLGLAGFTVERVIKYVTDGEE